MYQLLIIIFIVLLVIGVRNLRRALPEKRRGMVVRYGFYVLALIIAILVVTGRVHWIAAGIAALLPLLIKLGAFLMKVFPFLYYTRQRKQQTAETASQHSRMDVAQARQIFGFNSEGNETEDDIIRRHRELMQKNHPDRGGSDFLAAQINQAKEILLSAL